MTIYSVGPDAQGLQTEGQPLNWWEGGPAFVLASARAVRANFRGLYAYPAKSNMRDLSRLGWHGVPCNASAWALCSSDVGQAFPAQSPRMPERGEQVSADGWRDLGCSKNSGKVLTSLGVYDISACDVIDEGLDVLYTQGRLFHRHNTLDVWEYWILVVLSIVLVRSFSYNIQLLWAEDRQPIKPQWPALLASLVLILVVVLDGDSHFVSSGDQAFFWANVGYVGFYLGLHAYNRWMCRNNKQEETPVYNIIMASLQLVVCRLYGAAETPFNLVLLGILSTRAWYSLFFL